MALTPLPTGDPELGKARKPNRRALPLPVAIVASLEAASDTGSAKHLLAANCEHFEDIANAGHGSAEMA